jgi:hypothetical protein
MIYVKQNVASEDMVQLFDSAGTPVTGLADTDVQVKIRKQGDTGYSGKLVAPADWVDRGGGNYALQFSAADFDTLGLFQYQVLPVVVGTFVNYQDSLNVVEEIPSFPPNPPQINEQTDTPPGVSPDPVYRGDILTISGQDLGGAQSVTIAGESAPIIGNTDSEIQVVVVDAIPLGDDLEVVVTTPGGLDTAQVSVRYNPANIPGLGVVYIHGQIFKSGTTEPLAGVGCQARILDMPNIEDGVAWTDDVVSVSTGSDGIFEFMLPREKRVEVMISKIRYRRVFVTPDVDRADLFREIP